MADVASAIGEIPAHVPAEAVVDFDLYAPRFEADDPFETWLALRDSTTRDFVWTPHNGGHWITTTGDHVSDLLRDHLHFTNKLLTLPRDFGEMTRMIPLQVDPPDHRRYRMPVMKVMGSKYISSTQGPIEEFASALIAGFRDRGHCDFVTEFAEVLPVQMFLYMLDIPQSDGNMLRGWAEQLGRRDGTLMPDEFMRKLDGYLTPHMEERLARPGEDLFSRIFAEKVEGAEWTLDEAVRLGRNVLLGGLDTILSLLGFSTLFLARNPDHQQMLRDKPELAGAAADEFLRRFPIVSNTRLVAEDVVVGDTLLKKDDVVIVVNSLHNFDETAFDKPFDVDFTRRPVEHSTLGQGTHRCAGAAFARLELVTFLKVWMKSMPPFRVDPEKLARFQFGTIITPRSIPLVWDN